MPSTEFKTMASHQSGGDLSAYVAALKGISFNIKVFVAS